MLRASMYSAFPARLLAIVLLGGLASAAAAQDPPQAAAEAAGPAQTVETFTTRSGLPVTAYSLDVPAAVAQLWVAIPADLSAEDRRGLTAFAHALAEGRLSEKRPSLAALLAGFGGETAVTVNADHIVVSSTVPARHTASALAFLDNRLAARKRLLPASGPVPPLQRAPSLRRPFGAAERPAPVPPDVLQLWAPNHPYRLPIQLDANQSADAGVIRRLSDKLLRRGGVSFVVGTPIERRPLAVLLDRHIRTRLPFAKVQAPPALAPLPGHHALRLPAAPASAGSVSIFIPIPTLDQESERAALDVVAAHLGAKVFERDAGMLLMLERHLPSALAAGPIEHQMGVAIEKIAVLSDSAFRAAKARAITKVAARGQTLAGQVYFAASAPKGARLAALLRLNRTDVTTFFRQLQTAPRIVAREVVRAPGATP